MKMLHKDFSLELKQVDDEGLLEGYAAIFGGSPDLYGDVIAPCLLYTSPSPRDS